jgi:hypothetical protein
MNGTAMIYWLRELQWAREQILKAKTSKQKKLYIKYHKAICSIRDKTIT